MQPPQSLEVPSPPSPALQLRVGVDVGTTYHHVAIGVTDGRRLEEFEIAHTTAGFADFFRRIERHAKRLAATVAVAMEGYNGHARPLDSLVRARGWQLFNVNNLKLARFKEIFPAAAKTDRIDTRKTLELFQLRGHLPMAAGVLQEVMSTPAESDLLKRLARRRRRLVEERGRLINALQADLRATAPGLLQITRFVGNRWFLNFLTCRKDIRTLARMQRASLLKLPAIGNVYARRIQAWQQTACFGPDVALVSGMIHQDATRIRELNAQIDALEDAMARIAADSAIARQLASIPGFGQVCSAELAVALILFRRRIGSGFVRLPPGAFDVSVMPVLKGFALSLERRYPRYRIDDIEELLATFVRRYPTLVHWYQAALDSRSIDIRFFAGAPHIEQVGFARWRELMRRRIARCRRSNSSRRGARSRPATII